MENHISSVCRFCLEEREEFNHLAFDCPALWWERMTINSQDPDHSTPEQWTPQILDFTFFPQINEAFVKPLNILDGHGAAATDPQPSSQQVNNPDRIWVPVSVMDGSSLSDSSFIDDSTDSYISVDSAHDWHRLLITQMLGIRLDTFPLFFIAEYHRQNTNKKTITKSPQHKIKKNPVTSHLISSPLHVITLISR